LPRQRVTEQSQKQEPPTLTVSIVLDIWRMADLAWGWANSPLGLEQGSFDQLQKYADIYGIDTAELLFALQGILREQQFVPNYADADTEIGINPISPPSAPES
jgi:hypothetical protein